MTRKPKDKANSGNAPFPKPTVKRTYWFIGLVVIGLLTIVYFSLKPDSGEDNLNNATPAVSVTTGDTPGKVSIDRLVGRWLRPDGGYILEIRSATSDGKLDVGYLNPNPIHVARANWVEKDGKLYVMVEFQDVNYPGSIYGLEYQVGQDQLNGTYFQAVEKVTYDVQFVREK